MKTSFPRIVLTVGLAIVPAFASANPGDRGAGVSSVRTTAATALRTRGALLRRFGGLRRVTPRDVRVANAEQAHDEAAARGASTTAHTTELEAARMAAAHGAPTTTHYEPGFGVAATAEFAEYGRAANALVHANDELAHVQGHLQNEVQAGGRAGEGTPQYERREVAFERYLSAREAVMTREFGPGAELRSFPVAAAVRETAPYVRYTSALRGVRTARQAIERAQHRGARPTARERGLFESAVVELVAAEQVLAPAFRDAMNEHVAQHDALPVGRIPSSPVRRVTNLRRPVPAARHVDGPYGADDEAAEASAASEQAAPEAPQGEPLVRHAVTMRIAGPGGRQVPAQLVYYASDPTHATVVFDAGTHTETRWVVDHTLFTDGTTRAVSADGMTVQPLANAPETTRIDVVSDNGSAQLQIPTAVIRAFATRMRETSFEHGIGTILPGHAGGDGTPRGQGLHPFRGADHDFNAEHGE